MQNPEFRWKLSARYLAPFIIAMGVLTAILLWRIETQVAAADWVEQSDRVIASCKDAELEVRRIQLGLRGFVNAPNQRCANEISVGRRELARNLARVASLVAYNPEQEARLLQITDLKENWLKSIEGVIRQGHGTDPDPLASTRNQTRALFSAMEDMIAAEYQIRARRSMLQNEENRLFIILVPLLSAAVTLFLSYWGWRQIQAARQQFGAALTVAEEAKAKAEKASRAKDSFLSTVSHELRNPLNSIMLWSSTLLSDQSLSETTRKGLSAIDRAVRAQTQLVDDLLDISRIESGRMRLDVQAVDLPEVVRAAVESMRAAAQAKAIALQVTVDPRVSQVVGDAGRLQQVVWNLLSNAVKFTPMNGEIRVAVGRTNSHIEIKVADNGQGIDPASLNSVFDRFWQADNPGQSKLGVGLGLSIVREIVNLHGGSVSAQSQGPGRGSTFTIRLPLPSGAPAVSELRQQPAIGAPLGMTGARRLDGCMILVVDDDPGACDALKGLLTSLGARVTIATSAEAALAILDRMHPDAVVSDVGMPVQDGYFLAREVRKREVTIERDRRMPLVAVTAYGRIEDRIKVFEAGFDSHIVKPVDPAELSAILRSAISSRRDLGASA
jgi:signal transduction histidine kinase/ActR/RegA family two-component response regulator